jgi:hypothetical protein
MICRFKRFLSSPFKAGVRMNITRAIDDWLPTTLDGEVYRQLVGWLEAYFAIDEFTDDNSTESFLATFSPLFGDDPFHDEIWKEILDSGLLASFIRQIAPGSQLLSPLLSCFVYVLSNASTPQLDGIRWTYDADQFLLPILQYDDWIDDNHKASYMVVLVQIVRIYDANLATVFDRLADVAQSQPNFETSRAQIGEFTAVLRNYIIQSHNGELVDGARIQILFRRFMNWAFSLDECALLDADISEDARTILLKAVSHITKYCPQSCVAFYSAPWQEIDQWLRDYGNDYYPRFHKLFMSAFKHMAFFRPRLIAWNMDLFRYFTDAANPDSGIPALEITAVLFREHWGIGEWFPDLAVCQLLVRTLAGDSAHGRHVAVLKCLCAFLARVRPPNDGYRAIFESLAPFLETFMLTSDVGEFLYLCLFLLDWFVGHGHCDFEDLMKFESLSRVQTVVADEVQALDKRGGNEQSDEATLLILQLLNQLDRAWEWWNPPLNDEWPPPLAVGQTQWPLLSILPLHLRMPDRRQLRTYRATPGSLSAITAPSFYCHHDPLEYEEEDSSEYAEEGRGEYAEEDSNEDDHQDSE